MSDSPRGRPGAAPEPGAVSADDPSIALGAPTPAAVPRIGPPPPSERYRLEGLLGQGGMGRVLRAHDLWLGRPVALKLLRGAGAPVEARFLREGRSLARVAHPNLVRVWEVGRFDAGPHAGEPFLAMELVSGATLREAQGRLPLEARLAAVRDVARGVEAAHREGLVHRDLKPDNVLVEWAPGAPLRAVVADFGLARDLRGPGETGSGEILGTPEYLAPEQARGELHRVDARTDVWGLGALLYEALSGQPPHPRGTPISVLRRAADHDPVDLAVAAPAAPAALRRVAMKCLEREPARRYASAGAVADDLDRWLRGEAVQGRPSPRWLRALRRFGPLPAALLAVAVAIAAAVAWRARPAGPAPGSARPPVVAVADLDNRTGEPDLSGLGALVATSLEQSPRLTVLTRARVLDLLRESPEPDLRAARGEEPRLDEPLVARLCRRANADALLAGTLHREGGGYRLALRAIDARSGRALLEADEKTDGRAGLQAAIDRLARRAAASLVEQGPGPLPPVSEVTTGNLEAYHRYFRGSDLLERLKFVEAAHEFEAAVGLDPAFGLGFFQLGVARYWLHETEQARAALARAEALAARIPERERWLLQGLAAWLAGEHGRATAAYRACEARFPLEKECAFGLGDLEFHGGRPEEAAREFKRAVQLDPGMERALAHLARYWQNHGRWDELLAVTAQYVDRVGSDEALCLLGRAYAASGDRARAREAFRRAEQRFPHSALPLVDLAALESFEGRFDEAELRLAPLVHPDRPALQRAEGWFALSDVRTQAGRLRAAQVALVEAERAAEVGRSERLRAYARARRGMVHLVFDRQPQAARELAASARADGLPEQAFRSLYLALGDERAHARVLQAVGEPLAAEELKVLRARAAGDHAAALAALEDLVARAPAADFWRWTLADELEAAGDARGVAVRQQSQQAYPSVGTPMTDSATWRSLADLSLARMEERAGNVEAARKHAERFLQRWSGADRDRPELREAQELLRRMPRGR